jgi:formate dehydrogenase major subunit
VQRVRKILDARGDSSSDWEIIRDLAVAMGKGEFFNFNSAEEIWNEIREVWPAGRGISYERIEDQGLQWPCTDETHPGTEVLHAESFSGSRTAAFRRIKYRPTRETVSDCYPLLLTTGRTLYHFNAGTMTMRTPNEGLRPTDLLVMSPRDAAANNIKDGELVKLVSNYGETVIPVEISDTVKSGELFATFHDARIFLNYSTSPHRDRFTHAPEYKVTAVRIEKLPSVELV